MASAAAGAPACGCWAADEVPELDTSPMLLLCVLEVRLLWPWVCIE